MENATNLQDCFEKKSFPKNNDVILKKKQKKREMPKQHYLKKNQNSPLHGWFEKGGLWLLA